MAEKTVLTKDHGEIRVLYLNRPQKLNALNEAMKSDLISALARAENDQAVGAVVITGQGQAFSAGADLNRFAELFDGNDPVEVAKFTNPAFPQAVWDFPKPLIAAINGSAVGWGLTMPLMCDLRLASSEARFSCGFVRVGVTPEFGSSCLLPRVLGLGRAMELVLTGREFDAQYALDLGLISEITRPEDLLERACDLGRTIASFPRPAVIMAKAILRQGAQSTVEDTLVPEMEVFRRAMATPEHRQAVAQMMAALKGGNHKSPA
ncbi:MAG: enoyl-CoA hydratase/isomerase family protein [Desulfarculaceae bacterium]